VLTVALWLLTAGSVLATIYAVYGWRAAEEAQQKAAEQQALAEAQKLAAQSDLVFKTARVVETTTGEVVIRVPHEDVVSLVAFSPDARVLYTGTVKENVATLLRRGPHRRDLCPPDAEPDGRGVDAIPRRYPLSHEL